MIFFPQRIKKKESNSKGGGGGGGGGGGRVDRLTGPNPFAPLMSLKLRA